MNAVFEAIALVVGDWLAWLVGKRLGGRPLSAAGMFWTALTIAGFFLALTCAYS
jgi:CDP-diglyceride synthetase